MMEAAPDEILLTAQRHLLRGELAEAESICKRILAKRPNHPGALVISAEVASRNRNHGRAEYLLNRVLQREPRAIPALYLLGEVHRRAGSARKAASTLGRAMQSEFGLPADDGNLGLWRTLVDGVEHDAAPDHWRHRLEEISAYGAALEAGGELRSRQQAVLERLTGAQLLSIPDAEVSERFTALLGLAAFSKQSDPQWNRMLFEEWLLPCMKRALAADRLNAALIIEGAILNEYVAQTETEEHFSASVLRWKEDMRTAGRRFGDDLGAYPQAARRSPPRVAFFVHQISSLAHVRLMLDVLEGHASLDVPLFEPVIVCFRGCANEAMKERVARLKVEVVEIMKPDQDGVGIAELRSLRELLARRGMDAIVWVSTVMSMAFSFAMRVAPVQIWWAMKYHGLELEEIDGYLTAGSIAGGTRRIGERDWRAGPIAAEDWFAPALASEAGRVRDSYAGHRVLYGCFGREEKLNSPDFLDAVAQILQAVPDAGFLWTGRHQHPRIQASLEAAGVADRCHFIGWVNTRLYAQVIDVFLDSFPFPCGYTLYESMAAGRPAVLYASAEAAETGARSMIEPLLLGESGSAGDRERARAIFRPRSGEDLYLCAQDPAGYVALATRLAADEALRSQAGSAAHAFIEQFMSDRGRVARIYGRHLLDIIERKYRDNPALRA
jgi:glycosyltransferase involved in cell wall biosynthesis